MNRLLRTVAICFLAVLLACGPAAEATAARLQDDFYAAVNAQWLTEASIPADKVLVGSMADLTYQVEAQLVGDFDRMLASHEQPASSELAEFLQLYAMSIDFNARNDAGGNPIRAYLDRIASLDSFEQANSQLAELILNGISTPFSFSVAPDMGNAGIKALYAAAPKLFLEDTSFYQSEDCDQLLSLFEQTATDLLTLLGMPEAQARMAASQAVAFDRMLAPYARTAEENNDYALQYNPLSIGAFGNLCTSVRLDDLVRNLTDQSLEQVIVADLRYYQALHILINEQNFSILKSWMLVSTAFSMAPMLSEEIANKAMSFSLTLYGQSGTPDLKLNAYRLASAVFDQVVGQYYSQNYFSKKAKDEVSNMVNRLLDVYRKRLRNIDWLSPETIEGAIRKLDNMTILVGYPDIISHTYSLLRVTAVEKGGNFFENMTRLRRINMEADYISCGAPVDRMLWPFSACLVNAMYDDNSNAIIFPAAILQAPFFSLKQSTSANYGGIGMIIAHEITHAFDLNGAKYDESGSLKNWWTSADYNAFESRSQAVVDLFDGIEYAAGTVNGTLTAAENIADMGGLSSSLEAVRSIPGYDLQAFFKNFAISFRMKATPAAEQMLLAADPHAPAKLRVNIQLQNLNDFYTVYGVQPDDGMYLPPEKRVTLW